MHELPLVATIAAAFTSAWLLGLLTQRLRLSPIVGYLLAGVLIGPHTPGFVGDVHIAQQLAEVGVILLMFGVGLHFHWKDLLAVKAVAIPGAVAQSLIATLLAMVVFSWFGVPPKTGVVMGLALSVASTVVLMRVLLDADRLNAPEGHVAVGWLLVEDLFTVVVIVLIPALAGAGEPGTPERAPLIQVLGLTVLKLGALVGIVFFAGARAVPWVLVQVARLRSRELFTLTVLVFSVAVAAGSYFFFGASMALGAFLAGMVVAQSPVSHQAAADALPLRDAFAVLFFVSVGMLLDPVFLVRQPGMIAAALGIILIAKPLAAWVVVALLGHSVRTALTVAIGLAQIGEFSFILSDLARRHGLMTEEGHSVLVAAAILSITVNPLLFRALPAVESWIESRPRLWRLLNDRVDSKVATMQLSHDAGAGDGDGRGLAIVVGFGPVGRSVHRLLREARFATVVIDSNMDTISALRKEGHSAIFGDATHERILEQAGGRRASHVVITLSSPESKAIVAAARNLNGGARILVRAHYLRERDDLEQAGASAAVFEEAEAAVALARLVLSGTGVHHGAAEQKINDLRRQLILENVANIRSQRVRSVMVPWSRVRWLSESASHEHVLSQVSRERFSRWPVVETGSGRIVGYLHTKDLVAGAATGGWRHHVRPLKCVPPDEAIEAVLTAMQDQSASIYAVGSPESPLGLVTLGDLLEQVVGQIEDEYPHESPIRLGDALARGGVVLSLAGTNVEEAIAELVQSLSVQAVPENMAHSEVIRLVLDREKEISTDLGNGVAVPHAKVAGLEEPVAAFGYSAAGIRFTVDAPQPVHVLFLLLTPAERPEVQLSLLNQIAGLCIDSTARNRFFQAGSQADLLSAVDNHSRRKAG